MSRYIDADDVLTQKVDENIKTETSFELGKLHGWNSAIDYIGNNAPTADVRENVRGEWIDKITDYDVLEQECSMCGYIEYVVNKPNFCPNCGAKMTRGAEE